MAMYANGNESPTLRTYVSDETKVSFLNVSTFKSAQVPWTYFLIFCAERKGRLVATSFYFMLQSYLESQLDLSTIPVAGDSPSARSGSFKGSKRSSRSSKSLAFG